MNQPHSTAGGKIIDPSRRMLLRLLVVLSVLSCGHAASWIYSTSNPTGAWRCAKLSSFGSRGFAAISTGSIYYTSNAGGTWTISNAPTGVSWIDIDASDSGLYAVATSNSNKVFYSSNSGVTWTASNSTSGGWYGAAISGTGQYALASKNSNSYIWRSTDYGHTYIQTSSPQGYWTDVGMDYSGQNAVAMNAGTGPYYSTDYGVTWSASTGVDSAHFVDGRVEMGLEGGVIAYSYTSQKMYRSANGGQSFTLLSNAPALSWEAVACTPMCARIIAVAGGAAIYISTNSGAGWSQTFTDTPAWKAVGINLDGTQTIAAIGTTGSAGRIYRCPDAFARAPTARPTAKPTALPSVDPTRAPTAHPTNPTSRPSSQPSSQPTTQPTSQPSNPTSQPSSVPTLQPSTQPTTQPSGEHYATVLASPTYKTQNGFAFAAVGAGGRTRTWGELQYGGDSSAVAHLLRTDVSGLVGSRFAFAAVRTNGTLAAVWGAAEAYDGLGASGATSVILSTLVANDAAFAGVVEGTGKVVAFGSKHHGGNVLDNAYCNGYSAQLASGVRSIAATAGAFAAIKVDGPALAWGHRHAGADVSPGVLAALTGAKLVVANLAAFAVLLADGTVATWGERLAGGDCTAVANQLDNVYHIIAARSTFVAFKRTSGIVVWGAPKYGGDVSAVASDLQVDVTSVAFTATALAVVKGDGSVVTWGKPDRGGDSSAVQASLVNIVKVYGNDRAFAALTATGGVVTWGSPAYGGAIPAEKVSALSSGVVSIHQTDRAFAALKEDGSLVVWGQAGHGGSPSTVVEALLTSDVHTVCANDVAFSAIKTDGSVVAWGHEVSIAAEGVQFTETAFATPVKCA